MGVTHETDANDSNPDHAVPLLNNEVTDQVELLNRNALTKPSRSGATGISAGSPTQPSPATSRIAEPTRTGFARISPRQTTKLKQLTQIRHNGSHPTPTPPNFSAQLLSMPTVPAFWAVLILRVLLLAMSLRGVIVMTSQSN
jgi:hypothetical protein